MHYSVICWPSVNCTYSRIKSGSIILFFIRCPLTGKNVLDVSSEGCVLSDNLRF